MKAVLIKLCVGGEGVLWRASCFQQISEIARITTGYVRSDMVMFPDTVSTVQQSEDSKPRIVIHCISRQTGHRSRRTPWTSLHFVGESTVYCKLTVLASTTMPRSVWKWPATE
jgi:hypothetical protein